MYALDCRRCQIAIICYIRLSSSVWIGVCGQKLKLNKSSGINGCEVGRLFHWHVSLVFDISQNKFALAVNLVWFREITFIELNE